VKLPIFCMLGSGASFAVPNVHFFLAKTQQVVTRNLFQRVGIWCVPCCYSSAQFSLFPDTTWSRLLHKLKVDIDSDDLYLPNDKGTDSHKVFLVVHSCTNFKLSMCIGLPKVSSIRVAEKVAITHKGKIGHWNTIHLHGSGIFIDKLLSIDRVFGAFSC
jgi:hypothetical protein